MLVRMLVPQIRQQTKLLEVNSFSTEFGSWRPTNVLSPTVASGRDSSNNPPRSRFTLRHQHSGMTCAPIVGNSFPWKCLIK